MIAWPSSSRTICTNNRRGWSSIFSSVGRRQRHPPDRKTEAPEAHGGASHTLRRQAPIRWAVASARFQRTQGIQLMSLSSTSRSMRSFSSSYPRGRCKGCPTYRASLRLPSRASCLAGWRRSTSGRPGPRRGRPDRLRGQPSPRTARGGTPPTGRAHPLRIRVAPSRRVPARHRGSALPRHSG